MALVIKSWFESEQPKDGVYVKIVGRHSGLISWLLALVGIDATVTFEVQENHIVTEAASLSGYLRQVVPMRSISRSYYGFEKPWKIALALGVFVGWVTTMILGLFLFRITGYALGGLLGLVGGVAAGIFAARWYYNYEQGISIGFVEISAWSFALTFSPSYFEGQKIDEEAAKKIAMIIRNRIDAKTHS